ERDRKRDDAMRRLIQQDDRGVVTIVVIIAMALLLIGAALAIDVGKYNREGASAQHSADATALAIGTDCALRRPFTADYSIYRKTGQSITPPACGAGEVVTTVTKPVSSGLFLNRDAKTVTKTAVVKWGALSARNTIPITISACEWSLAILDGTTDIVVYADDTKPQSGCSSLPGGFSQLVDDSCVIAP